MRNATALRRTLIAIVAALLTWGACKSRQNQEQPLLVLAAVVEDGRWGFIDRSGAYVLGPKWAMARNFSEGLAPVNIGGEWIQELRLSAGGHVEYIDTQGKVRLEGPFPYSGTFCGERLAATLESNNASLFDRDGKLIEDGFTRLSGFFGQLSLAQTDDKVGYIDRGGKWVIELDRGAEAHPFSEGLAGFSLDGKLWGFLDTTGKTVIAPRFGSVDLFREGRAAVELDGKFGYIDRAGTVVVPPEWDKARSCSEKRCAVQRGERWGFVDLDGELLIKPTYTDTSDFHEDLAGVLDDDGTIGYIDPMGTMVIEPQFQGGHDFSFGLAGFSRDGETLGYIDKKGRVAIEPRFSLIHRFVDVRDCNSLDRSKRRSSASSE